MDVLPEKIFVQSIMCVMIIVSVFVIRTIVTIMMNSVGSDFMEPIDESYLIPIRFILSKIRYYSV